MYWRRRSRRRRTATRRWIRTTKGGEVVKKDRDRRAGGESKVEYNTSNRTKRIRTRRAK